MLRLPLVIRGFTQRLIPKLHSPVSSVPRNPRNRFHSFKKLPNGPARITTFPSFSKGIWPERWQHSLYAPTLFQTPSRSISISSESGMEVEITETSETSFAQPQVVGGLDNYVVFRDITVQTILSNKESNDLVFVEEDTSVFDAIQTMVEEQVGAILVTDSESNMVGIMTERDYLGKVVLHGLSSKEIPVKKIMTRGIITVGPDTKAGDCMAIMTTRRFRHLPVVDQSGYTQGLVSIGDLLKYVLDEQRETIQFLTDYIKRTY